MAALAPDDDPDAVPGRDHVGAARAGAGGGGGVGVQRRGLQRPLPLEVVGGSHVPAAGTVVSVNARYALPKFEIEMDGLAAPLNRAAGALSGEVEVAACST